MVTQEDAVRPDFYKARCVIRGRCGSAGMPISQQEVALSLLQWHLNPQRLFIRLKKLLHFPPEMLFHFLVPSALDGWKVSTLTERGQRQTYSVFLDEQFSYLIYSHKKRAVFYSSEHDARP